MKVFVVNCGSSSIKYQLFSMATESVLAKGIVERVGQDGAKLTHTKGNGDRLQKQVEAPNHSAALALVVETLLDKDAGVLSSIGEIEGVGHRVVHGGEAISASTIIDQRVIDIIKDNARLAPLHNPANLSGIESAMAVIPHVPHVAVFDTAFLATLPPVAYRYAVPTEWYTEHHVRRYGFHGTSHRFVTQRAAEILGKSVDKVNLITVHLGNGCSMTAISGGKAVDHSMGMTPLEGLVMGTRSGDIDPAIVLYMQREGATAQEIDKTLNSRSGLLGLSGKLSDMRDLLEQVDAGDKNAELAVEVFVYRIVKYIGAYHAILPGLDAVILTGGIGENSLPVRRRICKALARLGAEGDNHRNEQTRGGKAGAITTDASRLAVWVVPTNEELMIARDTAALAGK
ncbi:MAG: acetate kinase [Planctomycetaceae bacterium]|nr:acetate kinase [Planctomycetaceae bacterium]